MTKRRGISNPKVHIYRCQDNKKHYVEIPAIKFRGKGRWDLPQLCPKCGGKAFYLLTEKKRVLNPITNLKVKCPKIGGNPMAKKKRTKKMKILGIPVMTVVIIGGLVWLVTRS